jgi:preprotein translocase subunit SecG
MWEKLLGKVVAIAVTIFLSCEVVIMILLAEGLGGGSNATMHNSAYEVLSAVSLTLWLLLP